MATFAGLHSTHSGKICGYALHSDADGITICCAAHNHHRAL